MGVAIFTGIVAFLPSLISLAVQRADVTWLQVLVWAIPVALWLAAWRRAQSRATLLPIPIALFMAAVVAIPVPDGFTWPRLAGIALALSVTAASVSGLGVTLAWSAYAVVLLTLDYSRELPHAGHLSSSTLDAASTILGILVIPPAIAVVSRQWSRACDGADAASEASRLRASQALAAERAEAARTAVDRRIHETVLNTLATISRTRTSPEAAREQCAQDLAALDSLEGQAPRGVQAMLTRLLQRHPVPGPTITAVSSEVTFTDDETAAAAYVALAEVLRNVSRHARATRTWIRVRAPQGRVIFSIIDDGIGMDDNARQRFGMRRALRESVESSGGSVEVESSPGRGTTVTISVPLRLQRSVKPAVQSSSIDVLLRPPSVRLAMLSALVLGLILLVPAALTFAAPALIVVTYLVFAGFVVATAARWNSPRVATLSWLSLATLVACQGVAWAGTEGCTSAGGLHQVLFTTAAAMLLPPLLLRRTPLILAMVILVIVPTILVPWRLPRECRAEALVPAIETSLWVVALVGIIAVLSRAFDRSSVALAARWDEIADAEARLLAMQAADQRWRSVDDRTRELLASVADGTSSAEDPHVRATATRLEARLRSLLETSKIRSPELRASLEEVLELTTRAGVTVTVVVVSDEADGPVDPWLHSALLDVGRMSTTSGLHVTVLDGELLVSADRSALEAGHLGELGDTDDPATAVAVVRWESVPAPA